MTSAERLGNLAPVGLDRSTFSFRFEVAVMDQRYRGEAVVEILLGMLDLFDWSGCQLVEE
jgi:hypothetical protein